MQSWSALKLHLDHLYSYNWSNLHCVGKNGYIESRSRSLAGDKIGENVHLHLCLVGLIEQDELVNVLTPVEIWEQIIPDCLHTAHHFVGKHVCVD